MFSERSPRLPLELCDIVIHFLAGDKEALRACSLTCKAFLPASRSNLFHHVRLDDFRVTKRFFDNICATNSSTNPSTYVRRLTIEGRRPKVSYDFEPWTAITFAYLALITVHLVEVTMLELRYLSLYRLKSWQEILSGFRKVDYLHLMHIRVVMPEDVNKYIATFPSLTRLSCAGVYWLSNQYNRIGSLTPLVVPLPSRLRNITMRASNAGFFHRLLSHESHPDVHTLNFVCLGWGSTGPAAILLKTIGSSLEHLDLGELDIGYAGKLVAYWHMLAAWVSDFFLLNLIAVVGESINLDSNTNLRSISWKIGRGDESHNMDFALMLLSQIVSPHPVHVQFRLALGSVAGLDLIDWARMERILMQRKQANFEKLSICLESDLQLTEQLVSSRLPILACHGLLQVDQRPPQTLMCMY
jgi:hypothetical protein